MAEGAQQLPTDEELFEHPVADPPVAEPMEVDQVVETEQDVPQVEQPIQEPAPIVPMEEPVVEHYRNAYQDHHEPPQYYPEQQEPAPLPTGPVFQPTAYVAPTFVSQTTDGNGAEGGSPDNGRNDANEHTVWIDSDDETEEIILRQNFYLSYSDHNYDCADPSDRVVHPQGKALPKIGGLDEAGNIVNQWEEGMAVEPTSPSQIHLHSQPLQQQPRRPVNSTAPFAIGGSPVDYVHQRQAIRDPPQVRYEYGNGQMAQRVRPNQQLLGARGQRDVLFHPQVGGVRAGSVLPQRRSQPLVGAAAYMPQQARRPNMGIQRGPAVQGQPRQAAVRPVQLTRPLGELAEREFEHHQPPQQQAIVPSPAVRRAPEMAPHRMTPEQRSEMARGRSMAQFPMNDHSPLRGQNRPMIRGQSLANPMMRGRNNEELLRSPQRMADQSAQHHHPNLEMTTSPRKFQVKVTDSYSAPIAPKINELPAQLTEDPPEEDQAASAADEQVLGAAGESPLRQGGSPVKGGQKPTPPHRLQHDEKNAHLAKLAADKEKSANPPQQPAQHASMPPPVNHAVHHNIPEPIAIPPVPVRHHQDDALAMVQSVFDTTKPRLPDTPKDKEAISKIAENLRFSAEQYEKMPSTSVVGQNRRRHDSGMSGGHGSHPPYHPPDKRYELAAHHRLQNQQAAASSPVIPLRQPNSQMEPPHRPRGRPRGSTSAANAQKNRGPEPIAPHRVGGARTLPPRAQQLQQQSNGATEQANSDSESEGVDDWVMRCHCGMDHYTGDTIECEQCKSWQHTLCMGLKENDDTDGYKCERCMPRKLPITKAEAVRIQKREVAKANKLNEEEKRKKRNKRKSEPVAETKKPSTSNSRKSAPIHLDTRPTQLNEYSKAAASLLEAMSMTAGADTLLQESAEMKRAKRMFVSENVQALVTTMMVNQRAVVLEVNGFVSMVNEVKRQPGGGSYVFMYDGLMKGTAGEDMGDGHELICVDTKKRGNDSKFTRRSCEPNCVLKHVLGSHATLGVMIVATKDIPYNQEVTLPFDLDWTQSDEPLECADHVHNMDACPFEIQRRVVAAKRAEERASHELVLKLKMEAEKRDKEERKRLEDEVRREREEVQAKMDEEEREQERLEAEKKAQEKEEAKKKKKDAKEAEKAARKSEELSASARQSTEPTSSTREQRRIQQAEEMFRRIDEESRKKEKKRSISVAAEPSSSSTSARRSSARKSLVTPKKEEPSTSESRRTSRRLESINSTVSDRTASPPAKRPRASTVNAAKNKETNKRNAARLSSTPAAKRAKSSTKEPKSEPEDPAVLTVKTLREVLHKNSMDVVTAIPREEYKNPDTLELPPVSDWVTKLIAPSRVEDDRVVARHKEKRERRQKIIAEAQPSASTPSSSRDRKKSENAKKEKATVAQKEIKEEPVEIKKEVEAPVEQEPAPEVPKEVKTEVKEEVVKPPSPKKEKVKAPKKLSLSEYKQRKAANSEAGASTPTTSAAPATRRGFIPSTEGSNTANVQLSAIPLEDHLKPSTSSAPPPPQAEVDSSEDEPAAHKQSLAARVAGLIGMPAPATPATSSTPNTRARKSRWQ